MWRDVIIVFFIILLVVFFNFVVQSYINSTSQDLAIKLEVVYTLFRNEDEIEVDKGIDDGNIDYEKINELFYDFEENWNNIKLRWELVEPHSELDLIQKAFINSKTSIENKEKNDACLYIKELQLLISHIAERDSFTLKNIF